MSLSTRDERFALELLEGGGLLLDLSSGQVLVLNRTAAFIWERHLAGEGFNGIVAAFGPIFGVDANRARTDVTASLLAVDTSHSLHALPPPRGVLWYRRSPDGYRLFHGDTPLLEISGTGHQIRVLTPLPPEGLRSYLRALSPKIAGLRGMLVLHAAAVRRPQGDVIAFAGPSGAGKTTTARAFAQTGCELLCEDKLVVRSAAGKVEALLRGEEALSSFMADLQVRFDAFPTGHWLEIDRAFDDVIVGPGGVLAEIMLIDAARRAGPSIVNESLPLPLAGAHLFDNVFMGSEGKEEWRMGLAQAANIARTARVCLTGMPAGLDALRAAAQHYTTMTAS